MTRSPWPPPPRKCRLHCWSNSSDPGILVIPVGSSWDQELRVITRQQGETDYRVPTRCRFVPLRVGTGGE